MHTGLCSWCQQKLEELGVAYDDRNDDSAKYENPLPEEKQKSTNSISNA